MIVYTKKDRPDSDKYKLYITLPFHIGHTPSTKIERTHKTGAAFITKDETPHGVKNEAQHIKVSPKPDSEKAAEKPNTPPEPRTKHENFIRRSTTGKIPRSPEGLPRKTATRILIVLKLTKLEI
jgi:hypothetical protein